MDNMPPDLKQAISTLNSSTSSIESDSGSSDHTTTNTNSVTDRISGTGLGFTYCGACRFLAKIVVGYFRLGAPSSLLVNLLVKICYAIAYQSLSVCRGIIYQDMESLIWIIQNSPTNGEEICALLLGDRGCGEFQRSPWKVPLPPRRHSAVPPPPPHPHLDVTPTTHYTSDAESYNSTPVGHLTGPPPGHPTGPPTGYVTFGSSSPPGHLIGPPPGVVSSGSGKKVLKMLHLTDPHYDPDYVVGSNALCDAPLCCTSDSGPPKEESARAGQWGDYRNCDSPKWLLHHMLNHIITNHPDIDYVVCTGDLVPHHIWRISREENVAIMKDMSELLQQFFPSTPIYGSIGNHESFPRDSFPPPEVSEVWSKFGLQWLYDAVSERWEVMMGRPVPPSARYGGFYSILARPGLRIISLNTNYCYRLNWWVLYKSVDPGLMLTWLVVELGKAEANGEVVHIIGHIPPFYVDCFAQWGHQFSRVLDRFSHVIRGQFYGHSHMDEFRIHYGPGPDGSGRKRPVGVQYITPNNGPYHNLNPSYRVYYIDGDHPHTTRDVIDYETWVMNLTHANQYNSPHWYHLYSARRDLHLPSLQPRHWHELVQRMSRDPALFQKYFRYQVQDSDPGLAKGCDGECRHKTLCSIVDGDRLTPSRCRRGPPPPGY